MQFKFRRAGSIASCLTATLILAGCAETPMGSTASFVPPPGKSFELYSQEDTYCKDQAKNAVQGQAEHENNRALIGGVISTALGAGLGAAVGGGYGAGIGAASGAVLGGAGGAGYSQSNQSPIQIQYDNTYAACMTSRGNIPGNRAPIGAYSSYGGSPQYSQYGAAGQNSYQGAMGTYQGYQAPYGQNR